MFKQRWREAKRLCSVWESVHEWDFFNGMRKAATVSLPVHSITHSVQIDRIGVKVMAQECGGLGILNLNR